jgi:acetyltransferase
VVRAAIAPDRTTAEFAIVIRSELKGRGLGHMLLEKMIRYCRERGVGALVGQTLAENQDMLALARRLGFEHAPAQEGVVNLMLALSHPASENLGSE